MSKRDGNPEIHVMNADGSDQRRLIRNGVGPHWSPDGRMIAFTRSTGVNPPDVGRFQRDVWVVNADGSGVRNLSKNPHGDDWLVSWSPAPRVSSRTPESAAWSATDRHRTSASRYSPSGENAAGAPIKAIDEAGGKVRA